MRKSIAVLFLAFALCNITLADGSDPMPVCRHDTPTHKCPVLPPAVMPTSVKTPKKFDQTVNECHNVGGGCQVCRTHEGPVLICPTSVTPQINIDKL